MFSAGGLNTPRSWPVPNAERRVTILLTTSCAAVGTERRESCEINLTAKDMKARSSGLWSPRRQSVSTGFHVFSRGFEYPAFVAGPQRREACDDIVDDLLRCGRHRTP